jgi:sigma-B regulation protein RsbU (phosphoserine phosphatase)
MTAIICITVGYTLFVRAIARESRRRAEMEADVKLAQTIHESLLPKGSLTRSWCDAAGASIPAAQIGGDFYDLIHISEDRILAVVADASGHGTGAGILSAMTKSSIIQELRHTQTLSDLMHSVNTTIHHVTKKNMFVTCAAVLFDRQTMTAVLLTAGHPPILRYDLLNDSIEEFRNQNLALGIGPASTFASTVVPFRSGDIFCLITDGLTETSNAAQEQFGMERINGLMRRFPGRSAGEASAALINAVTTFSGTAELNDDVTTLVVRIV